MGGIYPARVFLTDSTCIEDPNTKLNPCPQSGQSGVQGYYPCYPSNSSRLYGVVWYTK